MVILASSTFALGSFLLSTISLCTNAHSWIDCIDTDRSKLYDQSSSYIFGGGEANGFCEGYGAGFPGRGNQAIGPEYTYKMLKNEVEAGVPVCQNVDPNTYSDWRKRISLAPGQTAYFAYLPNGHIAKDKKGIGTQHGVYWTGQPGTSLTTTHDMKPENLIDGHTSDYDDGNCGETLDSNGLPSGRAGDGKPCIGSFSIPAGTAAGIYKMVWYWTFWLDNQDAYKDQDKAKGYFGAAYSTCFEVEVTSNGFDDASVVQQSTPGVTITTSSNPALPSANVTGAGGQAAQQSTPGVDTEDTDQGGGIDASKADRVFGILKETMAANKKTNASDADEGSDDEDMLSASLAGETLDSLDNIADSASGIWDDDVGQVDDVTQDDEEESTSQSDSESHSGTIESTATSVKYVKRWVILGCALLFGGTLL